MTGANLTQLAQRCFPRNSWRCLVVHWLEHGWPGQVRLVISSNPLLFMAACFGRALAGIDLLVHEQAVNGGGRMLCLQERILHAALASGERLAVLMLLWLPKTYHPAKASAVLRGAQDGLAALGAHYSIPTLRMTHALAGRCARGEAWCYDRAHGTAGLHADLNHPNELGHALLAAHVHALLQTTAARVADRLARGAPAAARAPPLPTPLYPVNMGLGRGGGAQRGDSGLCVDVAQMAASAVRNEGWAVRVEVTKARVARLPALQADSAGASAEWLLDARGSDWLIVTYMQSYVSFGALRLECLSGCACSPHAQPGARTALINATDPSARFSEPQWALLDLSAQSERCLLRATSLSPLKFKLMLLSLIRVRNPDDAPPSAGEADAAAERARRGAALQCFGVGRGGALAVNERVRSTAPWAALGAG